MKKVLALAVFLSILCAWPTASRAEGITAGSQLVSGYLGGGAPTNESDIQVRDVSQLSYSTDKVDWGDVSVSYGAQYMYFLTSYLGIGAEVNGNNFTEAEYSIDTYRASEKIKSRMDVYNFMAVGRVNFNPQSRVRAYLPFGLGLAAAESTYKYELEVLGLSGDTKLSKKDTSFAYYVGAGVEADLSNNWVLGGELRYNGFSFDNSKFDSSLSKKDYGYMTLLFKAGYRF